MNIIFLDIDGVLNHQLDGKTDDEKFGFSMDCIENLRYILESVPNTKIVISSSWKLVDEMPIKIDGECVPWRNRLSELIGDGVVIGETPNVNEYPNIDSTDCNVEPVSGRGRGDDIALWIEQNKRVVNLENFVILDDNGSSGNISKLFPNNYVNCDQYEPFEGLSLRHAKSAIWILRKFGKDISMSDNTFFTSDTHFNHGNIIRYCNRPWFSINEFDEKIVDDSAIERMNASLIERWNSVVGKNDTVWHLGDFALGRKDLIPEIVGKLNGKINLVLGNHDHQKVSFYYNSGFHRVYDRPVIINDFFILSHSPIEWVANPFYNIFGHVHDNDRYKTWSKTGCCACVERHEYRPISWKTIRDHIDNDN